MVNGAHVVRFDSVIYLVLRETQPASGRPERDGYIQCESVFVAGKPSRDPTGRSGGIHPTWDRIAWREPSVRYDRDLGRCVTGDVQEHWRHQGGGGRRLYAIEGMSYPLPTTRQTPLESVQISDWARGVITGALTMACADLWTIECRRPESASEVQELWEHHVVQVSAHYYSEARV